MKALKTLTIFAAALSLFTLPSCNDDAFLEEHPKSMYTIDNAFVTSDQVDNMLTGVYIRLYDWYAKTMDAWTSTFQYKSFGTDVLDAPFFRTGGTSGYSCFNTWTPLSTNVAYIWDDLYKVVSCANLCIKGCEMDEITWNNEAEKHRITGEAHFFRGFAYLRLAQIYGGVPIQKEYDESIRTDYVRATREETYSFAIEELEAAYNALPDYPAADGKVGKGAAAHALAEAYLAIGVETGNSACYKSAEDYAKAVIALHPLMTSRFGLRANAADTGSQNNVPNYLPNGNVFSDLFTAGNFDRSSGNTEAIWVIQTPTYGQFDEYGGKLGYEPFFMGMVARDLNWSSEYAESGAAAGPWKGTSHPVYGNNMGGYVGGFSIAEASPTNYASYGVWTDPTDMRYEEDVTVRKEFVCFDTNHSLFGQKVKKEMLDQTPENISKYFPIFAKIMPLDGWAYRPNEFMAMNWSHDAYAMRSGESYLLLAEAYLRQGKKAEAADALNAVRTRANCTNLFSAAEMTIDVILDERIRECLFEEGRWYTFLRMEPEVWKKRISDHSMYWSDFPTYKTPIAWDLWPIPQNIIELNTIDMPQNKGWN